MQVRSDLIRILLLEKYGGVWIDATVCLNMPLTPFLTPYQGDFFCTFRWENKISMSNWFLCAAKDSYIARKMASCFYNTISSPAFFEENRAYFSSWKTSPHYFIFHVLFERLQKEDAEFGEICRAMPWCNSYPFIQFAYYGWNKDLSLLQKSLIKTMPLLKLSWTQAKTPQDLNPNGALSLVLENMHGTLQDVHAHIHLATELRPMFMLNSYIDRPEYMKAVCGVVDSESDLKLPDVSCPRYHVFNFSSHSQKNGAQLLIPYNQDRIFLRHQTGKTFSSAVELVPKTSLEALERELNDVAAKYAALEKTVLALSQFVQSVKMCVKKIPFAKKVFSFLKRHTSAP